MKKQLILKLTALSMIASLAVAGMQLKVYAAEDNNVSSTEASLGDKYSKNVCSVGETEEKKATGAIEDSEEVKDYIDKNVIHKANVDFNDFARKRIEKYNQGISFDKLNPSDFGLDRESLLTNKKDGDENLIIPNQVDNSKLKAFPGIGNQGTIGSCAAFASTYYNMSYTTNLFYNRDGSLEENKMSPKWTYNMTGRGANLGSTIIDNFMCIQQSGVPSLKVYPYVGDVSDEKNYTEWSLSREADKEAQKYNIKQVYAIDIKDAKDSNFDNLKNMKKILLDGYLLNFGTNVDSEYDEVKDDPNTTKDDAFKGTMAAMWRSGESNHAMTIVGYNDDIWIDLNNNNIVDPGEKGAFRVANSWGGNTESYNWAYGKYYDEYKEFVDSDKGFFWVSYDALSKKSLLNNLPESDRVPYIEENILYWIEPEMKDVDVYAEITLNSVARDEIQAKITGRNLKTEETTSLTPYEFDSLCNRGRRVAFDGSNTACDKSFIIDLSRISKDVNAENINDYEWTLEIRDIVQDSKPVIIKDFKIVNEKYNREYKSDLKENISLDCSSTKLKLSSSPYKLIESAELVLDKQSPQTRSTSINLSTDIKGGSGNFTYEYSIINPDGTDSGVLNNKSDSTCNWFTPEAGDYKIKAVITDNISGEKRTLLKDFKVSEDLNIDDVTFYCDEMQVGKYYSGTISVTGGASNKLTYTYTLKSSEGDEVLEEEVNRSFFSFIPRKAGYYTLNIKVTDEEGHEISKDFGRNILEASSKVSKPTNISYENIGDGKVRIWWDSVTIEGSSLYKYCCYYDDTYNEIYYRNYWDVDLKDCPSEVKIAANAVDGTWSELSESLIIPSTDLNNTVKIENVEIYSDSMNENESFIGNVNLTGAEGDVKYTYTLISEDNRVFAYSNTNSGYFTFIPRVSGKYTLKIVAVDEKGNWASKDIDFEIGAAKGSISKPSNLKYEFTKEGKVKLSWDAVETNNCELALYYLYIDDSVVRLSDNHYEFLDDNSEHKIKVIAVSTNSLYSEMSDELNVPLSTLTINNLKGDFTCYEPTYDGIITPQGIIGTPINFTADVTGGIGKITYSYSIALKAPIPAESFSNLTDSSLTWTPKYSGYYMVTLHVEDEEGNSASKSMVIYINEE